MMSKNSIRKILIAKTLRRIAPWGTVLGEWFKTQNVSCVPSQLEPLLVSNRTGNRGVDLKDRFAHQNRGCTKLATETKLACGCLTEGMGTEDRMKTKDNGRKWMWRFLGVLVALQLYFVRELLAAFALFALAFAAIAFVIVSLYMLQKSWEVAVARVADSNHPLVNFARRGVSAVEDMARRPLRRPGSATPRAI
jgi:predicted membrane protein